MNLFLECPRCFYLSIVKGIKRPSSIFPSLPSGMDKVLKEHFDRFMEKGKLPPEIKEKCKDLKLFSDKEKLKIFRSNLKGISFLLKKILVKGGLKFLIFNPAPIFFFSNYYMI